MPNTYITDRTASDCQRIHTIYNKLLNGTASASEISLWNAGMKGALNMSDLSRLADIYDDLRTRANDTGSFPTVAYSYAPSVMKSWTQATKVTKLLLINYFIDNAQVLKTAILTPTILPESISDYEDLNTIESFLSATEALIDDAPSVVDPPTNLNPTAQYNAQEHTNGYTYDSTKVSMTGQDRGTLAGTYVAVYTPISPYVWKGSLTTTPITVTLTINPAIAIGPKPTQLTPSATYSGQVITNGYIAPEHVTVSGDSSGTNVGTYTATYKPEAGYVWDDYTEDTVTITLTINTLTLTIPSLTNSTQNYTGSALSPTVNNFNSTYETQSGTSSAENGGTYTITWSLRSPSNTKWSDNTVSDKTGQWTIQYVWTKWNAESYLVDKTYSKYMAPNTDEIIENLDTPSYSSKWSYYRYASGYTFDSSTGKYTLSGGSWLTPYITGSSAETLTWTTTSSSKVYASPASQPQGSKTNSFSTIFEHGTGTAYWGVYDFYNWGYNNIYTMAYGGESGGTLYYHQAATEYKKGSTLYADATSTSLTYPENGRHTDGYWYVKTW